MAVALQDHLTKQYSLSLAAPLPRKQQHHKAPPLLGCGGCGKQGNTTARQHHVKPRQCQVSINTDVLALNTSGDNRELVTPDHTVKISQLQETERVLEKTPPPLTLAQRLGLVEAPPRLLSGMEWAKLKTMSNQRNDSASPCPICQEHFGLSKQVYIYIHVPVFPIPSITRTHTTVNMHAHTNTVQVLLSCSHVFHLSCLKSLERFSGCKRCPMCRRENYQKRIIYEGANCHRQWAATL